jgi:hypothetical protein
VRHLSESLSESFGVLQGAMLGVGGLLLAFGLSLALSRYENRREAIVEETNAIGTTYLRAQTLAEPVRGRSLHLLVDYTEEAVRLSSVVPESDAQAAVAAKEQGLQRRLWALAGDALDDAPVASAPRLYVETLNEMFDAQTTRIAGLNNRVPGTVLVLEIIGAAVALGLLAAYVTLVGRGAVGVVLAAVVVAFLLFVTVDLDRPTRGLIRVPDTVLASQLASMQLPPAAVVHATAAGGCRLPASESLAEVIVRANRLAGDLVARGGVRGLDFACLRQHLVDLAVRNQHGAGGVGEHILAGHHAHALEDHRHVCLKRRQGIPSPASRLT